MGWRPCYGLIHLMQNWWSLTNDAMEDALIDNGAIRPFAGIDLVKNNIPDATTILAFRHVVEQHQLAEETFKTMEQYLEEKGLLLREGTVVDATIIHAPTSTKNEKMDREPEMHQTRKGNQWFFGMKVQIGVNKNSGLIHSVATTSAHVSDGGMAAELLHGEEKVLYGDAGYQGLEKRGEMAGREVNFRIAMGPGKRRHLPDDEEGDVQR